MKQLEEGLVAERIALVITQKCVLNCRLCCNSMPLYSSPENIKSEKIKKDLGKIFELFTKVKWLQFVGGEIFLHPDFAKILRETLVYKKNFDKLILMSSGTIEPKTDVLEALQRFGQECVVQISDYGKLSYRLKECIDIFERFKIPYQVKSYHGNMQYYGGWVDNTSMKYRGYSKEQVQQMFDTCWQIKMSNWHVMDGKLHNCIRSLFATDLGFMPRQNGKEADYVDFYDDSTNIEEKRKIVCAFDSKPLSACQYCSGFDSLNAVRYPAAEQITGPIKCE